MEHSSPVPPSPSPCDQPCSPRECDNSPEKGSPPPQKNSPEKETPEMETPKNTGERVRGNTANVLNQLKISIDSADGYGENAQDSLEKGKDWQNNVDAFLCKSPSGEKPHKPSKCSDERKMLVVPGLLFFFFFIGFIALVSKSDDSNGAFAAFIVFASVVGLMVHTYKVVMWTQKTVMNREDALWVLARADAKLNLANTAV